MPVRAEGECNPRPVHGGSPPNKLYPSDPFFARSGFCPGMCSVDSEQANYFNKNIAGCEHDNIVRNFLKKITGTLFFAPETFETLTDNTVRSALSYTAILFAVFLLVKSAVFLFFSDSVNAVLGSLLPRMTILTEMWILDYPAGSLRYPEMILFYAGLVLAFLLCCIVLSHLLVIFHQSRIGPDAFRTPPDFRQTTAVVLNSTASLFLPGLIPGIGLIIGFTWFSITVHEGVAAWYGKDRRKGMLFSYYYPSFDWHGGSFIMILWIGMFIFGMMAYRLLLTA